ncbi:MAG: hypothetical protein V4556_00585 [Bacteroidota bacterium]
MTTNNQVGFISDKIQQLQTAILYSNSNCVLKLPTCLARTLYVDEVGCVWISIQKPRQLIREFDRTFEVELNYYKKGTSFFLNISGMARIIIDPEEINQLPAHLQNECGTGQLLLCVRILEANYHENQPKALSIVQRWMQNVSTVFTGSQNDYHFDIAKKNYAV